MVDIETLGVNGKSPIGSIAAVPFDGTNAFYVRIKMSDYTGLDFVEDESTVKWWQTQPREAYDEAFGGTTPLKDALQTFADYFKTLRAPVRFWAKSPEFDAVILKHALGVFEIEVPWKFWNQRDVRTVCDVARVHIAREGTHHNALHDCYHQIREVKEAIRRFSGA